ncbi:MAG: lytic transglycosylase domain-containing protein [Myxococcota bacterium]|nr:lytic transglycosylase domain-containing protein [Myxococcota bacterium]
MTSPHDRLPKTLRVGAAATCALALASIATADPGIDRRIEALRSLEAREEIETPDVSAAPPRFTCPEVAPWKRSRSAARERADGAVRDASLRFAVPADLLRAMIRHESAGRADAVSSKGAMGLMQLMPRTAEALGVVCPFDPRENVLAGARYLRQLHDSLGSWKDAVAGYHAGPSRVRAGELPAATVAYQERVMGTWRGAP